MHRVALVLVVLSELAPAYLAALMFIFFEHISYLVSELNSWEQACLGDCGEVGS